MMADMERQGRQRSSSISSVHSRLGTPARRSVGGRRRLARSNSVTNLRRFDSQNTLVGNNNRSRSRTRQRATSRNRRQSSASRLNSNPLMMNRSNSNVRMNRSRSRGRFNQGFKLARRTNSRSNLNAIHANPINMRKNKQRNNRGTIQQGMNRRSLINQNRLGLKR